MIKHSATLAINEKVAARRARGQRVLHLGFGEAGLPVLPEVADVLRAHSGENSYGPVAGSLPAREAAAGYFGRRGVPTTADQIMFAPGSKALLYGVLAALPGDLVLPQPSWVTYAAQAALTGKRVIGVGVPDDVGGVPEPDALTAAVDRARRDGADPRLLLLTLPDNPTGTAADPAAVRAVCEIARREGLTVISDEIYRDLVHDGSELLSPAQILPEHTIVTGGLSKNMALGGYRIGFVRLPDSGLGNEVSDGLTGVASEVWSSLATPMQEVAAYVLGEPDEVTRHIAASRRLHAAVSAAVYQAFVDHGAQCRRPNAAFYLYPDLSVVRPGLQARGIDTGESFAEYLIDSYGLAVLAGVHFGDDPEPFRFRAATSLLYGSTPEQRWAALDSADPLQLQWIGDAIEELRAILAQLTG